jgi:hypothetical protein
LNPTLYEQSLRRAPAASFVFAMLVAAVAYTRFAARVDKSGGLKCSNIPCETDSAPSKNEKESFSANVLIVKAHSDIENWVKLEPAKRGGDVGRVRSVAKGVKFYLPIVATFSRSQVGQRVALSAEMEIVAPDGKVQKLVGCCLANHVDPRAPTTIVLNPVLDITLMRQIQAANTSCGRSTTVRNCRRI